MAIVMLFRTFTSFFFLSHSNQIEFFINNLSWVSLARCVPTDRPQEHHDGCAVWSWTEYSIFCSLFGLVCRTPINHQSILTTVMLFVQSKLFNNFWCELCEIILHSCTFDHISRFPTQKEYVACVRYVEFIHTVCVMCMYDRAKLWI